MDFDIFCGCGCCGVDCCGGLVVVRTPTIENAIVDAIRSKNVPVAIATMPKQRAHFTRHSNHKMRRKYDMGWFPHRTTVPHFCDSARMSQYHQFINHSLIPPVNAVKTVLT
jgi:hypothetical protein